jgi:hypothetical protein
MVDGPPGREFARQQSPGATALEDIEEGIQDLARSVDLGATSVISGGYVLLDVSELFVGKVGMVSHNGSKRKLSRPSFRIYQTVSRRLILRGS